MKATVVTTFKDTPSGKVYRVGEPFPLENVPQERIDLLTKPHPKTKKIYLYVEAEQEPQQEAKSEPSSGDTPPVVEETKPKPSPRKKTKPEPSDGE